MDGHAQGYRAADAGDVPGEGGLFTYDEGEGSGPEGFNEGAAFRRDATRQSIHGASTTDKNPDGEALPAALGLTQRFHGTRGEGIRRQAVDRLGRQDDEFTAPY